MNVSVRAGESLKSAFDLARANQHQEVEPTHLFLALAESLDEATPAVILMETFRDEYLDPIPKTASRSAPVPSVHLRNVWTSCVRSAREADCGYVTRMDVIDGLADAGGSSLTENAAKVRRSLLERSGLTAELRSEPEDPEPDRGLREILEPEASASRTRSMATEVDVGLADNRVVHAYDTRPGRGSSSPGTRARRRRMFWLHGSPDIGSPPEPLFAAAEASGLPGSPTTPVTAGRARTTAGR